MYGARILVLIPHPDDEVVACAANIQRAQDAQSELFALYLTTGCLAQETRWPWQRRGHDLALARRRVEAEKAAQFLGLKPVGFSLRPTRGIVRDLAAALGEIREAVVRYDIDQLWVPAYEGGHADHDAVNFLAALLRKEEGFKDLSILEFAEYNFAGGKANPNAFPIPGSKDQLVRLTPQERERKAQALAFYKSERGNLGYTGCSYESFRPLPAHDYSRPPHKGTLWYARFHWVPFRHPRIDFTKPSEVCASFCAFARANAPLAAAKGSAPARKG